MNSKNHSLHLYRIEKDRILLQWGLSESILDCVEVLPMRFVLEYCQTSYEEGVASVHEIFDAKKYRHFPFALCCFDAENYLKISIPFAESVCAFESACQKMVEHLLKPGTLGTDPDAMSRN